MNIEKIKISKNIFLLVFENQFEITSSLLRFQEHYESPEFRNKIFSLEEYKTWYTSIKGNFTYYQDWNGFNFPSYVLKPFFENQFNPLSEKEKFIVNLFKEEKNIFYVIGVHKDMKNSLNVLNHEIAHGMFYTDNEYKKDVLEILSNFNIEEIKKELSSKGGYHEEVLNDEVHAYSLEKETKLKAKVPLDLHEKILDNFNKASKRNQINLPSL